MSQTKEFEALSDIQDTVLEADIHFAIECLSPVKKANSGVPYFHGTVTDGSRKLRLVGFNQKLQTELSNLSEKNLPVKVESCQLKRGRSDDIEILLNKKSKILASPKKLEIPSRVSPSPSVNIPYNISLKQLDTIEDGELVNLTATVTSVAPARPVSSFLIQDITIVDNDGSMTTLSAWDVNIDKFESSETYSFTKLLVRSFKNNKTLSLIKSSTYEIVQNNNQDTSLLLNNTETEVEETITCAKIIGTRNFTIHYSCVKCSSRLTDVTGQISRCSNCNTLQVMSTSRTEAAINLLFESKRGKIMLTAYTTTIMKLLHYLHATQDHIDLNQTETIFLTKAPPMTVTYSKESGYIKEIELIKAQHQ